MMSTTVIRFSETWFSAKKRNSLSSRRVRSANTVCEMVWSGAGQHDQSRRTGVLEWSKGAIFLIATRCPEGL